MNEMPICNQHEEEIPLIWTFKFDGCELWCPYCGYKGGMFGTGTQVPITDDRIAIHDAWVEKARPFLAGETEEWEYQG